MAMTLTDLLALLPDNTTGEISAADMRTIVTELFNASHLPYASVVNQGPFTLATAAAFAPLPSAVTGSVTFTDDTDCMVVVSCHLDTMAANNAVQLAIALTGATVVAAGSKPEQVLWAGGKQAIQSSLEVSYFQTFKAGTTTYQAEYTAQAAGAQMTALAILVTAMVG
jgi:hypothetical protein